MEDSRVRIRILIVNWKFFNREINCVTKVEPLTLPFFYFSVKVGVSLHKNTILPKIYVQTIVVYSLKIVG